MRTALVSDGLNYYAGAEKVLEQMLDLYPVSDLFCTFDFLQGENRRFLRGREVKTSFIQRAPLSRRFYRQYFPLMPLAVEQFDLSRYDLVISSSHAYGKGVLTGPEQIHICYCHSPVRYAWDLQHQYLSEAGLDRGVNGWLTRALLHYIRMWDVRTAHGVDYLIANSKFIAGRIRKAYGRQANVIYPPVDTKFFCPGAGKDEYYLAVSRLVPYKRTDLLLSAFEAMPDKRLVIIGGGPLLKKYQKLAPPNVQVIGPQSDEVLREHYQRARALIFAAEEDFGMVPVEAQACGTPVAAYGKGGARETVLDGDTGVLFEEQTTVCLRNALERLDALRLDSGVARKNAIRFSVERFRGEFASFVEFCVDDWRRVRR